SVIQSAVPRPPKCVSWPSITMSPTGIRFATPKKVPVIAMVGRQRLIIWLNGSEWPAPYLVITPVILTLLSFRLMVITFSGTPALTVSAYEIGWAHAGEGPSKTTARAAAIHWIGCFTYGRSFHTARRRHGPCQSKLHGVLPRPA